MNDIMKEIISFRVHPEIKKIIEKKAKSEFRTVANFSEMVFLKGLQQEYGVDWEKIMGETDKDGTV